MSHVNMQNPTPIWYFPQFTVGPETFNTHTYIHTETHTINLVFVTWLPRKLGVEEAARQEIETREATAKEKVSLAEEERAKER